MNDPLPDMFADYYSYCGEFPLLGIFAQSSLALGRLRAVLAGLAEGRLVRATSQEIGIYGLDGAKFISFDVDDSLHDHPEVPGSALDHRGTGIIHWRGTRALWDLARLRVEELMEHDDVSCCYFLPGAYADDSHVCIELGGPASDTFRKMMRPAT